VTGAVTVATVDVTADVAAETPELPGFEALGE
jgi:hypothetical protein